MAQTKVVEGRIMNTVTHLLNEKHRWDPLNEDTGPAEHVHTITEGKSVLDAAKHMDKHRVGALLVKDTLGRTAGIFTERDILTRVVSAQLDPATTPVSKVMTRDLICCTPKATLESVRQTMTSRRIRHMPVIDEDRTLLGMISIGDLNAAVNVDLSIEVQSMRQYIIAG